MTRGISKTGFGQLDIPVIPIDQVVGITERQRIGRMGEGGGIFFGGAQLADQRILLGGHQQLRQVARGRYVVNRQARLLNVASMGHAQRLGLGVHGANKYCGG